ncbi:ATP-dependent metallopeptidase FtsH/Yme1/Tma family protein, partial [Staphylococcus aureus]|uniref:ATP-dependent metallopeptidase FtsH/Yme1/Tma family protein n=1 Tax=Staphylococcus aureus TaxID=1280 RepID=UPI0021B150C2
MYYSFRNVLVIVIIVVIIFGLISYLNGNGNMPKHLKYKQFTEKIEKGELKTKEIQQQQK